MISQPVVEQVIMVVSEIGDAWSPKILPPNIAPATNGMLLPMEYAIGSAITAIIAIVPIEVPVAKEIRTAIRKVKAGRRAGLKNCWKILELSLIHI